MLTKSINRPIQSFKLEDLHITQHRELGQMPSTTTPLPFNNSNGSSSEPWSVIEPHKSRQRLCAPFVWCLPRFKSHGRNQDCCTVVNLSSEGEKHGGVEGDRGFLWGMRRGRGVNKAQAAKESEQTFAQRSPSAPGAREPFHWRGSQIKP